MAGLATASAASANDVVLWACHGPGGQALGSEPFVRGAGSAPAIFDGGCGTEGTSFDAGGVRATGTSGLQLQVPINTALSQVTLVRRTAGLGEESGGDRYFAKVDDTEIEGSSSDLSADTVSKPATGGWLKVGLGCTGPCSAGSAVDIQRAALKVSDTVRPVAVAGGINSDVSKTMKVEVRATDVGIGLDRADVYVNNQYLTTGRFGDGTCRDLTPADATIDLPLGADCPAVGVIPEIDIQTTDFTDGDYTFSVKVFDAAGNMVEPATLPVTRINNHPDPGIKSRTLNIGSGDPQQTSASTNPGGSGGVAGATATSCSSPKLSMFLSQKPVKVSKGVPVLKYAKRYRFRGRLTCVVAGKRRSAPRRTRIDLLNTIGKKTYEKGGATVRDAGQITLILAYKSSRTLVFRYTNADGRRSQVKIKIQVAKKP